MISKQQDIKNFSRQELQVVLTQMGMPKYTAQQIFTWVYKKQVADFTLMTNITKERRHQLSQQFYFSSLKLIKQQRSSDGTQKYVFALADGAMIESVMIPDEKRVTLCVSTQVGCKFGCSFCCSGKEGFERNLTVAEIINQYSEVSQIIGAEQITNVVFMGIGEPLDNFANVMKAIDILQDAAGIYLGKKKITISTCGLVPQILRLAQQPIEVKLAVSLHAADDDKRNTLMPINRNYPLAMLMPALRTYCDHHSYPITFEYVLLKGFNTTARDAKNLSMLLRRIKYKLNLISVNYSWGKFSAPDEEEVMRFINELKKNDIFFTFRKSRGEDIMAACGQLKARQKK